MKINSKKALVLLNMGGPNNLHEVELFLKNMFNDPHILSIPSKRIRRLVAGIITTLRVEKSQEAYRYIGGKSPLVDLTNKLSYALEEALNGKYHVISAMRYTPPFASDAITLLMEKEIEEVILFPMYPHYSTTTTASSIEDFIETLDKQMHFYPKMTIIPSYYDNKIFNTGIIDSILQSIGQEDPSTIDMIFSAHGLPQKVIDKGDHYQAEVEAHVALLKKLLQEQGIRFNSVTLSYQSKVGPMKWLEPSLEQSLTLLKSGKRALIYPIAFTIDNSETVFELHEEYREVAQELGYEFYRVVPALNNHPRFVEAIKALIEYSDA